MNKHLFIFCSNMKNQLHNVILYSNYISVVLISNSSKSTVTHIIYKRKSKEAKSRCNTGVVINKTKTS